MNPNVINILAIVVGIGIGSSMVIMEIIRNIGYILATPESAE